MSSANTRGFGPSGSAESLAGLGSINPGAAESRARRRPRAVLLINLGTPNAPDARSVQRYLAEFLSDPAVIHLPKGLGWLNRPLGHLIARRRAEKSASLYRKIWTEHGSPLGSISEEQTNALQAVMPPGWRTYYAMRYGEPSIGRTLETIRADGVEELVVIPMYPQFSGTTTGTAVKTLYDRLRENGNHFSVAVRNSWYEDGGYIYAQAKLIHDYATAHGLSPDNTRLIFSAHGLPVSYVKRGDPYPDHVRRSIELVTRRLGWPADRVTVGYQSRMGPAKWLEPNLDQLLEELAQNGEKRLLVCPISFTVDCLETLEEIDVQYRSIVESNGAELFLCPALNTFGPFIAALKDLAIRGSRPVACLDEKAQPLRSDKGRKSGVHRDTDALVMVGVSKANRLGSGHGPTLEYSTDIGLCATKKAQCDLVPLLREVCEQSDVSGAFVLNTCSRYEFYGWLTGAALNGGRDKTVEQIKQRLFARSETGDLNINVRFGQPAWHHLMRTACGLNSGLPGDKDVLDQLETALRVAERAGTADENTKQLVDDAFAVDREVRRETSWGDFDPGYCYAALARVSEKTGLSFADNRCVVFGGSTTSRSVLSALGERFEVPTRTITLVYRGHGSGQMKLLRKAIGNGKRLRVGAYHEQAAVNAVLGADVVVLGIDASEPVLHADAIRDRRDFKQRPLTIIDFNSFGSTKGMETIEGVSVWTETQLDAEVIAYGETMCALDRFVEAVEQAEQWIVEKGARRQCQVNVDPDPKTCETCGRPLSGTCARREPAFAEEVVS
ncbi:MAG: ferrochelatase [Phycisphaerae bacterium]|jgi:ferrochelatase